MIENILKHNRAFVESKAYEAFTTDKYPEKKVAIVACMDTRLTCLLPAALGIENGDAVVISTAGAVIHAPYDGVIRSLLIAIYELGVEEVMVVAHTDCGACHLSSGEMCRLMASRGISDTTFAVLQHSGIDLTTWLEGFHDTEAAVRTTVSTILDHPLIPKDIRVYGFIIDSTTGLLTSVE